MSDLAAVVGRGVPRETIDRLERFLQLVLEEGENQNLIAASTREDAWQRHVLDSAQLVPLSTGTTWFDVGSGAGFPGMIAAILTDNETLLCEPRRLRADFLRSAAQTLGLTNVRVEQAKPTTLTGQFDAISARAVASAHALIGMTLHLSHKDTVWLLPKGRNAQKELDEVRASWQGYFRLEPSKTDAGASILIASQVRPRGKR